MASTAALTRVSTPKKVSASSTPVTESPGTWRHPRLREIARRQQASSFTEQNIRSIAINVGVFLTLLAIRSVLVLYLPSRRTFSYNVWYYTNSAYLLVVAVPVLNVLINLLPLVRRKDDLSDIPLTPAQRKLLGLPPASAPPTPGSVYSTPPRYSRTPSMSGSAGSRRSFSGSPVSGSNRSPASNYGTPAAAFAASGGMNSLGFASPGSPLLQKAMNGARRSSLGSLGSPSPLGGGSGGTVGGVGGSSSSKTITGASLFNGPGAVGGGGPESPSPGAGKRSSVGFNPKWVYERGLNRRKSGMLS